MKRIITSALFLFVLMLFVSCGSSEKETSDTGDTSNNNQSDSGDTVPADTDDTVDTTVSDDSTPADDTDRTETETYTENEPEENNDTEPADNDDAENDAGSDDSDDMDIQGECTGLSLDLRHLIPSPEYQHIWYLGDDPRFFMQFYFENGYGRMPAAGTYDLGSGLNTNYKTCTECVSLYKDAVNKNYTTFFFQESGTLEVASYDENSRRLTGTLSAKLVEVTINDESISTPVADGSCIEIEAAAFDSDVCVPQCDGKDCGDDGCGGTCGTCGHDQGCSAESKCVDLDFSGCTGLSVDWSRLVQYSVDKFYAVSNGGSDPRATIQFAQNISTGEITPGTYDLGSEINSHYKTCTECVLVYSDLFVNASGYSEYAKKYFQHDGTLVVSSVDEENRIKGTLSARILEATMDDKLMTSFVLGGTCFEIESAILDTPAE